MGFTSVEFYRLLQVSRRREIRQGEMICVETKPQKKMYFVLSGVIDVLKGSRGERKKVNHQTVSCLEGETKKQSS